MISNEQMSCFINDAKKTLWNILDLPLAKK